MGPTSIWMILIGRLAEKRGSILTPRDRLCGLWETSSAQPRADRLRKIRAVRRQASPLPPSSDRVGSARSAQEGGLARTDLGHDGGSGVLPGRSAGGAHLGGAI